MKFVDPRPFADPEVAARKLVEFAPGRQDLYREDQRALPVSAQGTPAEYKAGLERAIGNGWLWLHESGTFVKFTEAGAALLT